MKENGHQNSIFPHLWPEANLDDNQTSGKSLCVTNWVLEQTMFIDSEDKTDTGNLVTSRSFGPQVW